MDPFVNFVIRPPRADYSIEDLLEPEFSIKGRRYQRRDIEIRNSRGYLLQCTHYLPLLIPEATKLPCVIYCHGNSGCRADGNEAALVLLPSNIMVFTLDFSGSGLSDGDYVSLGWNEKDDLKAVVSYLRSLKHTSCIGLWGRSMGAVTSLLYGAEDPSIAGLVLDSPFSNLYNLMMELVDVYKIRLPKFTIRVALQIMRRIIQKRALFDIMHMNIAQLASKTFMPALFGHAKGDVFVPPHHSDLIHQEYAGDKNIIKFEGDHNSLRPQFYYDSVTIFFHNVLCPPTNLSTEDSFNLLDFDVNTLNVYRQSLEHLALSGQVLPIPQTQNFEEKESICQSSSVTKPENTMQCKGDLEHPTEVIDLLKRVKSTINAPEHLALDQLLESRGREPIGDCFSYPSSNGASTEGWGRCSSQGLSGNSAEASPTREHFAEAPSNAVDEEKMLSRAIDASLQELDSANTKLILDTRGIGTRKRCKFESLSRKFKLRCFRGVSKRNKGTP
ncbi:hypothetical protein GOP47_0000374 [Adiantum capillus-veneris]|uniref:Serine aminopeptidase S33 domain-containing protein n=1 Tax=Adiantum capillus-veneris TaxID=13818 RepID=A0A9D4ZT09_ADICA|nr:hypothetical protein GOP47_0000374 [Adiantum capillus-veneris]